MRTNTAPIGREALLAEANNIIRQHEDYLHGMIATDVEQKNGVLVFRGEYFLDADGLPTAGQFKRTLTLFGENTEQGREKFR
ncbi:DUF2498 family protein, partial [Serratia marcescens]|uniref:DUF2498 family protein n=1 Tax=Serratia marcescens TaxID=615 RepID=UPI00201B5BA0